MQLIAYNKNQYFEKQLYHLINILYVLLLISSHFQVVGTSCRVPAISANKMSLSFSYFFNLSLLQLLKTEPKQML